MQILITGVAGFIGFHLARRLLAEGQTVVGVDNLSPYYDVKLKNDRLAQLSSDPDFRFLRMDLVDRKDVAALCADQHFDFVLHMAAQAGVRYSQTNPHAYADSNLVGFINLLESCRCASIKHFVFASSSSVYGANAKVPFSEHDPTSHPISLYGATKRANELLAHAYAHLYSLPCTGLRFFTVYGPWGRPDMALFLFTRAILEGRPIELFNYGKMQRDFTYIDDVVEGTLHIMKQPPSGDPRWDGMLPDPATSCAPFRIYNIGPNNPVDLCTWITMLEECLGKVADKRLVPLQAGDVPVTHADIRDIAETFGRVPQTPLKKGIQEFVRWYREYYSS